MNTLGTTALIQLKPVQNLVKISHGKQWWYTLELENREASHMVCFMTKNCQIWNYLHASTNLWFFTTPLHVNICGHVLPNSSTYAPFLKDFMCFFICMKKKHYPINSWYIYMDNRLSLNNFCNKLVKIYPIKLNWSKGYL